MRNVHTKYETCKSFKTHSELTRVRENESCNDITVFININIKGKPINQSAKKGNYLDSTWSYIFEFVQTE